MIKKVTIITIILVLSFWGVRGEKIPIPGVLRPTFLAMDDDQVYITDNMTTIKIFSKGDYKLIKEFGKKGEGPTEFMVFALVTPLKDKLLVNSMGKISYYTKDGVFIKEIKSKSGLQNNGFLPVGKGFVARGRAGGEDGIYSTINFFDGQLAMGKEIYRTKMAEEGFAKINLLKANIPYQVHMDKIFVPRGTGFTVDVLNEKGDILFTIKREDYKPPRVTKKFENQVHEFLKKQNAAQYEFLKTRLYFPEFFPVFSFFFVDDKAHMIYLFTWRFKESDFECFVYDIEGKFQKHTQLPIELNGALQPYPLTIRDWKLYQLIDNEETEEWELTITEIK